MSRVVAAALLLAAVIHALPVVGVLGNARIETLYGIALSDENTALLLRHRAVLFGLLAVVLAVAAFRPAWQPAAIAAGLVSTVSFLVIAVSASGYNDAIRRVVIADWVAVIALALAALVLVWRRAQGG